MASTIPKTYRKEIVDALDAESLKVALFTNSMSTWTGLVTTESTYTQVAAADTEATGSGYVAGGSTLAVTPSYVGATNVAIITADTTSAWTITGSLTCRYAVIYENTGKKIRAVVDLGGDKTVTDGTITITWDATNGILKVS